MKASAHVSYMEQGLSALYPQSSGSSRNSKAFPAGKSERLIHGAQNRKTG